VSAARREYSEEVRTLASKVQSRDPRVLQHDLEVKREKVKRERGREREGGEGEGESEKGIEGVLGGGQTRRVQGRADREAGGVSSGRDGVEEVDVEARERRERDKQRERDRHEQELHRLLQEMLEEEEAEASAAARACRSSSRGPHPQNDSN
jgi:hypothetical protein